MAKDKTVAQVAEMLSVSRQALYDWLKVFLLHGIDSPVYRRSLGRKPRLTQTQRRRLVELVSGTAGSGVFHGLLDIAFGPTSHL